MIQSISIENFLSIKEKITLDLEASSSSRLSQNYIELTNKKEKLLKSVAIYGANSSGKSNIIKGIHFMLLMILNSGNHKPSEGIIFNPFLLDEKSINDSSKFEIIFILDGIKYNYGFSFNHNKIEEEYLYYWSEFNRENLIFERNEQNFKFNINQDKKNLDSLSKLTLENNLFLSKAAQLNYDRFRKIYEYFLNNLIININPNWEIFTIKNVFENEKLKSNILNILNKTDFGCIKDIIIKKEKKIVPEYGFVLDPNNPKISHSEKEEENFEIFTIHLNDANEEIAFPLNLESDGTRKFFYMLGPLLDILENGKILVVDELELNLHPEISKFIVKMFNSEENKGGAQLIFTTHDTNLLDNDLFRKDQIFFTNKKINQSTDLDSLFDYDDIRETTDFEKAYLNGRIGGVPFIDFN